MTGSLLELVFSGVFHTRILGVALITGGKSLVLVSIDNESNHEYVLFVQTIKRSHRFLFRQ